MTFIEKKAKNKTIRILTNARKSRAKLKRKADTELEEILNDSDTETIRYAEPYRNTSKAKDEIYRRNAKKKAIKILTKKKKRSNDARYSFTHKARNRPKTCFIMDRQRRR